MSQRVLLIDNNHPQALHIKHELARYDLDVEVVDNGAAAIRAARHQPPCAIVLDIELAGTDGYSLCQALKRHPHTSRIPIVVITNRDAADVVLQSLAVGADDVILKDVYTEVNLVETLRYLGIILTDAELYFSR